MRVFKRVAELASFTQAADQLGMPKASISTAVRQLEQELGTRLLQRTTRTVQMTPDGKAYYERCSDLLADVDDVQGMFRASDVEAKLAANWSAAALAGMKVSASGLNSDLHASAEYRAALIPVLAGRAVA